MESGGRTGNRLRGSELGGRVRSRAASTGGRWARATSWLLARLRSSAGMLLTLERICNLSAIDIDLKTISEPRILSREVHFVINPLFLEIRACLVKQIFQKLPLTMKTAVIKGSCHPQYSHRSKTLNLP